jgi:hypothetical protein
MVPSSHGLCVRDSVRLKGLIYVEKFLPVAKPAIVQMVFMLVAAYDLELDQIDVRAAY